MEQRVQIEMHGLLVLDKPGGMTSRDALNGVQKWFPRKTKIGHTGTLDPLATGVLVVCVGAATRLAAYVQAMGKTYSSRFRLGTTSSTDDADGELTPHSVAHPPTREQIDAGLAASVGIVSQVPPAYSAIMVSGTRSHSLARDGRAVELASRNVIIDAIRVTCYEWPFLDVEIDCGKGTYIRSIARDLGATLGCGGMVETLRRMRVGPFSAERGVGPDTPSDLARAKLLPMATAIAGMPEVTFTPDEAKRFRTGQTILPNVPCAELTQEGAEVAVLDTAGELVGIGRNVRNAVKPDIVFKR